LLNNCKFSCFIVKIILLFANLIYFLIGTISNFLVEFVSLNFEYNIHSYANIYEIYTEIADHT